MLSRTFVFLPGIGPVREMRLWRHGVDSWQSYRELRRVVGVKPRLKAHHDSVLEVAETSRGRDPTFFARILPTTETWRAYDDFEAGAAYLDIETTGDRQNAVTVVGIRKNGANHAFVLGATEEFADMLSDEAHVSAYTPEAVSACLQDASFLVTFNGAAFDLPVLANDGVKLPDVPHADLRFVLARVGLTGGLKKIEETMGLARDGPLAGLTGWDAVKLWRRWESRADHEALRTLVAYNVADFENLEPLARVACDRLRSATLAKITAQVRLDVAATQASPLGP